MGGDVENLLGQRETTVAGEHALGYRGMTITPRPKQRENGVPTQCCLVGSQWGSTPRDLPEDSGQAPKLGDVDLMPHCAGEVELCHFVRWRRWRVS